MTGKRLDAVRRAQAPIVGRDRELACLQECWARARVDAGGASVVVFRGAAGVGKSRLAAAAAEMVERSGAAVLELVGSPLHTGAGLYPVRVLLERRCGIGGTSAPRERLRLLTAEVVARRLDPAKMVPLLAPVLGIGADAGYEPIAAEGRKLYLLIVEAIHGYLLACVGDCAGLVIAEDLHWFDTSTLELLAGLLHASRGRLLVVITDRTDQWPPPGWPAEVFDLNPLTDTDPMTDTGADARVGAVGDEQDWPLVGLHYARAERFSEAASAYQQAAVSARRRGGLAEAHGYLTQALTQLDRITPDRNRDRQEMALRLDRGVLSAAVYGEQDSRSVADFERCRQLGGADLGDDQSFAMLVSLAAHHAGLADTHRLARVLESLSAGVERERDWFRPVTDVLFGVLEWLRGEFDAAASCLERAAHDLAVADVDRTRAVLDMPIQPDATAHLHLAWVRVVRGDLTGAEAELAAAARGADELDFPQGPLTHLHTRFFAGWIAIETGQLDRAAVLFADIMVEAQRCGFDGLQLMGAIGQAAVSGIAALGARQDPARLTTHAGTVAALLDTRRSWGFNAYTTFFDAVLGRLLIAAGRLDEARDRLNTGLQLAADIGMSFYDAELLRLRAHTRSESEARRADVAAALDLARRQGAAMFELRTALTDFDLRGAAALAALSDAVGRMAPRGTSPELGRARAILAGDVD